MDYETEKLRRDIEELIGSKVDWTSPHSVAHALELLKQVLDKKAIEQAAKFQPQEDKNKHYKKLFGCISPADRNSEHFILGMLRYFYDREGGDFFYDLIQSNADSRLLKKVAYLHQVQVTTKKLPLLAPEMELALAGRTEQQKEQYIETLADFQKQRKAALDSLRKHDPERDFR